MGPLGSLAAGIEIKSSSPSLTDGYRTWYMGEVRSMNLCDEKWIQNFGTKI